jgi:predicted sulfurtransferase
LNGGNTSLFRKYDQCERKQVDGKVLITRKGSNERIRGNYVKLSSD